MAVRFPDTDRQFIFCCQSEKQSGTMYIIITRLFCYSSQQNTSRLPFPCDSWYQSRGSPPTSSKGYKKLACFGGNHCGAKWENILCTERGNIYLGVIILLLQQKSISGFAVSHSSTSIDSFFSFHLFHIFYSSLLSIHNNHNIAF